MTEGALSMRFRASIAQTRGCRRTMARPTVAEGLRLPQKMSGQNVTVPKQLRVSADGFQSQTGKYLELHSCIKAARYAERACLQRVLGWDGASVQFDGLLLCA